jgi:hypothetical protein
MRPVVKLQSHESFIQVSIWTMCETARCAKVQRSIAGAVTHPAPSLRRCRHSLRARVQVRERHEADLPRLAAGCDLHLGDLGRSVHVDHAHRLALRDAEDGVGGVAGDAEQLGFIVGSQGLVPAIAGSSRVAICREVKSLANNHAERLALLDLVDFDWEHVGGRCPVVHFGREL